MEILGKVIVKIVLYPRAIDCETTLPLVIDMGEGVKSLVKNIPTLA